MVVGVECSPAAVGYLYGDLSSLYDIIIPHYATGVADAVAIEL